MKDYWEENKTPRLISNLLYMVIPATATDESTLVASPICNIFLPILIISNIGTSDVWIDFFAHILGEKLGIYIPAGTDYPFDLSQDISRKIEIYAKCLPGETTDLAIISY